MHAIGQSAQNNLSDCFHALAHVLLLHVDSNVELTLTCRDISLARFVILHHANQVHEEGSAGLGELLGVDVSHIEDCAPSISKSPDFTLL